MSNQNNKFIGGFLAGTIFGSIAGGLLGTWLASKLSERLTDEDGFEGSLSEGPIGKLRRQAFGRSGDLTMEEARQGLEDKIAQLNNAIDQARDQLSKVNSNSPE